MIVWFVL